ncbi:aromatic ring-hydroxylating oxygenase subunit alpha [Woodsholea maritima]|uniref:aromatic ring-hydroxylating oxygenase subunit alpha n=1 Tax=Woodsholea maritima TaxID=240237 RepID=UPI00036A2AEB|nr:aromatic ring-hydroxylating dioxygenase subunit alpha [Woodsholea maritima]
MTTLIQNPAPEMTREDDGFLRDMWYVTVTAKELKPGKMLQKQYLGEPVLLGRDPEGRAFALRDICPHRAVPLSKGQMWTEEDGQTSVACPYHGWRFNAHSGQCVTIPSLVEGQNFDLTTIKVRRYPVYEQDGLIWVYFPADPSDETLSMARPPRFANMVLKPGQSEGRVKYIERAQLECHQDNGVIGLLDPAHTPYVHQSPLWRSSKGLKPKEKHFAPTELGFTMLSHKPVNSPLYNIIGGSIKVEIQFILPGLRAESIRNEKHGYLGLAAVTPIHKDLSEITQIMYWDTPVLDALSLIARPFTHTFLQQDARVMRWQGEYAQYNPTLMQIPDADTLMVWYKRLKREWVRAREDQRDFDNPIKPAVLRWRT